MLRAFAGGIVKGFLCVLAVVVVLTIIGEALR